MPFCLSTRSFVQRFLLSSCCGLHWKRHHTQCREFLTPQYERMDLFIYFASVFKTADIHSGFFQSRLSTFVITFRLNLYQGAQVLPFLPVFKRDKSQTTEQRLVSTHPWQQSVSSETKTTGKKRKLSVYTKLGIVPGSRRLKRFILTEITYR